VSTDVGQTSAKQRFRLFHVPRAATGVAFLVSASEGPRPNWRAFESAKDAVARRLGGHSGYFRFRSGRDSKSAVHERHAGGAQRARVGTGRLDLIWSGATDNFME
jgi:hypothetical protein